MNRNIGIGVASLTLALALAGPTQAATIVMDPDGPGGAYSGLAIDLLDVNAGSGIALGLTRDSNVGDTSTFLFQANVTAGYFGPTQNLQFNGNAFGADAFTIVAAVTETIAIKTANSFTFALNPAGPNFFQIWADGPANTGNGNNQTGTDFSGGTKIKILEGTFLSNGSFLSSFVADPLSPSQHLDQFNCTEGVNCTGPLTRAGDGSFGGDVGNFTTVNLDYFPLGLPTVRFQASTELHIPFKQVDPTACFFFFNDPATGDCSASGGTLGVNSVGAVNGESGPNTMLQLDPNISFTNQAQTVVPEPATMTLFGLGLASAAAARRRRQAKK